MTLHFLTLKTGNTPVSFLGNYGTVVPPVQWKHTSLGNYGTVVPPVQWKPCLFLSDVVAMACG